MSHTRVAIVGSRGFKRLDLVRDFVRELPANTVVISGGARGVDLTAENEARALGLQVVIHRPDWKAHGRAAGPMRNSLIVEDSDAIAIFWDGESRGTYDSMTKATAIEGMLADLFIDEKMFRWDGSHWQPHDI